MSTKAHAIAAADHVAFTKLSRHELFKYEKNIPAEIRQRQAWLVWKCPEINKKSRKVKKVPVYATNGKNRSGTQGSAADLDNLVTFDQALEYFRKHEGIAGVGFCTLLQFEVTALDVDHCFVNGVLRADVEPLISDTYAEVSPSDTGVRALFLGGVRDGKNHPDGYELFSTKGFVTITGRAIYPDDPLPLQKIDDPVRQTLEGLLGKATADKSAAKVISSIDRLRQQSDGDLILQAIKKAGLYERNMGDGKHSILCPFERLHSDSGRSGGDGDTLYFQANTNGYATSYIYCHHSHHQNDMAYQDEYLNEIGYDPYAGVSRLAASQKLDNATGEVVALSHNPTQDNLALICRNLYRGEILYAHQHGKWYENVVSHWVEDRKNKVFNMVREVIRRGNREGKSNMASANFCRGTELFCRADPAFAIDGSEFDQDHYLLNTPADTVDLRTGEMRQHSPDDLLTKITAVAPTTEGGARFLVFLSEITGGDDELVKFHKVSLGACLSGAVESHWLLFWSGLGRNGKNTLGDAVMFAMGGYALQIATSTLMDAKHEAHPTELAQLQGVRLAIASEVTQGSYWNESRINSLTGDALISARFMRQDYFTFPRTHKHLIYGNHRPQLRNATDAVKARLKIVPFKQSFVGREDPLLPQTLKQEAGFILQWLIEGHAEWLRLGRRLPQCQAVEDEVAAYFADQSTVESWVAERCECITTDGRLDSDLPRAMEMYRDYQNWKQDMGEVPLSMTKWGLTMSRLFEKVKYQSVRYRGVALKFKSGEGVFASLLKMSNEV
jgi:putative DNA primase/helicase